MEITAEKIKILDFKTVSPLFEMERDGIKPFTVRRIEKYDKRQRALSQWNKDRHWGARITNPDTGEQFLRMLTAVSYLRYFDETKDDFWERQAYFYERN